MTERQRESLHQAVRKTYAEIAQGSGSCCDPSSCCEPDLPHAGHVERSSHGRDTTRSAPPGADMGLGCGNPHLLAALQPGETVLDLGSGGGFDCLLAARAVGEMGQVIGVDMTPEMIDLARTNARQDAWPNVEFRLGEIEHLPVADGTVDVIISNCVVNLASDKAAVFREACRVLKVGGRLAIADMVAREPLPDAAREDADLVAGCLGGALTAEEIEALLLECGFTQVKIELRPESGTETIAHLVASATVEAIKP